MSASLATPPVELASAATPAQLEAWLKDAAPGGQAVYAMGTDLPREAPGVKLVQRWIAEQRVTTTSARDAGNRDRWRFFVIKASSRPVASLAEGRKRAVLRPELTALLAMLRRCAERGKPCPSNSDIQRELRLRSRRAARYLFDRAVSDGLIAVEGRGPNLPRVVTIVKSGKETAR